MCVKCVAGNYSEYASDLVAMMDAMPDKPWLNPLRTREDVDQGLLDKPWLNQRGAQAQDPGLHIPVHDRPEAHGQPTKNKSKHKKKKKKK